MFHFTLPQQQQQFDQFAILNDPYIPSSSDNSVLTHKLNAGFTYLIYLKESNRILNDRRAFNTFAFLNSLNIDFYYNHFIDSYFDKISIICANLCYNYLDFLKKYVKNGCISNQNASTSSASDLDGFQFQLMNLVYEFILKITDRSKLFSNEFLLHKGVNSLINYFNDENLIKKLIDFKHMNYNGKSLLNNLLAIILNISVIADNAKVELNVMNAYGIIEKLIKQFKQNDNQRILAFMILINTGNDKQIEILLKSHKASIIQELEKIIKLASSEISGNNLNLKRFKTHVEIECEDGVTSGNNIEIIDDICFVCYNGYAWNLSKIFVTLICLASIDDFIKYDIYETYNLKDDLERIIFYGNHVEKLYATKLLWHCCLDGNVAKKFVKTPNLFDSIINTAKQVNFKNGLLKKYCDGIIWSIQPKVKNEEIAGGNCENESKNGHIMISYNSKSRSLCTKIKEKLESENHIVWIDYEKIHGSSLDSMALAIEESKCVLMCMNENYKESPNCRAEAEYAFRLNKPIIPLIMQKGYKPNGWLGLVAGTKIYIDFTKNTFEESMKLLEQQISLQTGIGNFDKKQSTRALKIGQNFKNDENMQQFNNTQNQNSSHEIIKPETISNTQDINLNSNFHSDFSKLNNKKI